MATYIATKNGSKSDEQGLNRPLSKVMSKVLGSFGVFGASDLRVSQRSGGANMSVDIAPGDIAIDYLNYHFHAWNTDVVNKTIASNTSGQPRIDAVVAYINLMAKSARDAIVAANPTTYQEYASAIEGVAANEEGGMVFVVVQGTPSSTPSPPDDNAIRSVIGASNPYKVLAHVNVANNQNEITEADIVDRRPKANVAYNIYAQEGALLNGKILPSVTSGNLKLEIKTLSDEDPSPSNPVYVMIKGVLRSITSALSVTRNAGTNWFNAGSTELATREIDYFAYLGYNAIDGVVIGFSRIPFARRYGDFTTSTSGDKYCAISTTTNAAISDPYRLIGRFAATLSAVGSGYTWSVPTFTETNLIQSPIYTTRFLSASSNLSGFSSVSNSLIRYRIFDSGMEIYADDRLGGTSNATTFTFTLPFIPSASGFVNGHICGGQDNGTNISTVHVQVVASNKTVNVFKTIFGSSNWTTSGTKMLFLDRLCINI